MYPQPESIKLIQDKMDLNMIQHLSKNAQRNISEHISKKGKFTLTVKEAEEFEIEF
jgi:actin-like ATPase involved in cell morphogenesis